MPFEALASELPNPPPPAKAVVGPDITLNGLAPPTCAMVAPFIELALLRAADSDKYAPVPAACLAAPRVDRHRPCPLHL